MKHMIQKILVIIYFIEFLKGKTMGKLTKVIRDQIIAAASKDLFTEERDALNKRGNVLADAVFDKHVATPAQYAAMKKLPNGFFNTTGIVRCRLTETNDPDAYVVRTDLELSQDRLVPAFISNYNSPTFVDPDAYAEFQAIENARGALEQRCGEIISQIGQVVFSANTTKRLLEIWPEGAKFIPAEAAPTSGVPMVLVSGLNAALVAAGVELSPAP